MGSLSSNLRRNLCDMINFRIWWLGEILAGNACRNLSITGIDLHVRAREDLVIVKNVPYYKAKKAWEAEVMNLDVPTRPQNWGTEEELKDPAKLYEKTVLLNAQREIADTILDAQWKTKWHQEKVNLTSLMSFKKTNIQFFCEDLPSYSDHV
ncbi:PREDICTED: uncharacterized protein LOC104799929 [Tarenaya hassleriana]|uniref:uncharacterized protein LOC104799929 n=1 Tax=Tarenaya hassleriana TaxID=28532 RepID=UPI00053C9890|nr:PREDICTED: uncharacterized protein LOC104799929 [Tarenaya hassleriana]